MIAMAIANDPDLLIADEPTTALDVTIQAQVMEVLAEMRERTGAALILITHDLGLVAGTAETVNVMYGGRFFERGNLREVFYSPENPYTRGLLASLPALGWRTGAPRSHRRRTSVAVVHARRLCIFASLWIRRSSLPHEPS